MMAVIPRSPLSALAEVAASLLEPDVVGPLNELSEALVLLSGLVSKIRRMQSAAPASDLASLDDAAARAIALTRTVREHFQSRRLRGEYTSLSHVVREVAGHLHPVMPRGIGLDVRCPLGPAIVAAERAELRRLVVALLEAVVDTAPSAGVLHLEVTESRARQAVMLHLRGGGEALRDGTGLELHAKPLAFALGGTLQVRAGRDGIAVAVSLPSEC